MAVVPFAKAVYLCEEVDVEGGMLNLYGLFNSIRAPQFPHRHETFVCFAQLLGGLGTVPCHVDVRRADTNHLVHCTNLYPLRFPDRETLIQFRVNIEACVFDSPGVYLVELYCDNVWVADTALRLREDRA